VKYLLDTHVVLWIAENSPLLTDRAKTAVLDDSVEKYVSVASAWEVAIKLGTRKLYLDGGLSEFFRMIDDNGFLALPVEREHLQRVTRLPPHHKDPFDRLLVASAIAENMTLLTADENIPMYDVTCLW